MRRIARVVAAVGLSAFVSACSDSTQPVATTAPPPPRTDVVAAATALGDPLPGLSASQRAAFFRGKAIFEKTFTDATGLGPIFNASSCAECHGEPGAEEGGVSGGAGDEVETHFSKTLIGGVCDPLSALGGFVHQDSVTATLNGLTGLTSEPFPSSTHQRAFRTTPDLFGFGLLAAVPNLTLILLSDPFDLNGDGISGRVHFTAAGDVGKFGKKANEGSLTLFNAGALLNEMGITNRFNPVENTIGGTPLPPGADPAPEPEISNSDFDDLNSFVLFLAPPPQLPLTAQATIGKGVFSNIGCASCHVPSLFTTNVGIPALSFKQVNAFTDLLLHDMGPGLADACLDKANPSEFRTEPLMGLRFMEQFLHDGRATTVTDAISQHGGEAAQSRNRFNGLSSAQRAALLAYLNSL